MLSFISNIISGLSLGSIYALIALGYTMVYGIAKMLNFAHGDIIMVGAYTVLITITTLNFPPIVGVLAGVVMCVLLGVTPFRANHRHWRELPAAERSASAVRLHQALLSFLY